MKAPFRFSVWRIVPRVRPLLDQPRKVEPASVGVQPRCCTPIVMNFALLPEVDANRVEESQNLGRIRLIPNLSEVLTVTTLASLTSTLGNAPVAASRGFNVRPHCPRPENNEGRLFLGSCCLSIYFGGLLLLPGTQRQ